MTKLNAFLIIIIAILIIIVGSGAEIRVELGDRSLDKSLEADISKAVANYYHGFSNFSPEQIARELYGAPLSRVGLDGTTTVWNTETEVADMVRGFIANLKEQQWHHSDMPVYEICSLGPNTALISGVFVRYREDGSEISQTPLTYLYQKNTSGWRVSSMIYRESDVDILCV